MNHLEKETNFVSAVIYCHNNEHQIAYFLEVLYNVFFNHFQKFEFIIANDASTDDTVEIIKKFASMKENNTSSIVNMSFFQGVEKAMNAGVDHGIGDFIFEFDTIDIDYEETLIYAAYQRVLTGFDILSVRNTKQKFTSKMFYSIYNLHSKSQYRIGSDTFRILSRRAINRIHSLSSTIHYRKALYANSGLQNDILNYKAITRSNMAYSLKTHRQETAISTLIIFTDFAYRISLSLSFLMMLASFTTALYTIIFYLLERSIEGFTTIMLFLTGSFFGVFAILTIVIKYLSILVDLVFLKQKYLIQSIEKVKGL